MRDSRWLATAEQVGQVAQLVEQRIENPRVGSSILPLAIGVVAARAVGARARHYSDMVSGGFENRGCLSCYICSLLPVCVGQLT